MRGHLPDDSPGFVGRRTELARVSEALAEHRLVTVTGVGGVGKTRLALRAAHRAAPLFPDGAWWTDLTPLDGDRLLLSLVADSVDLSDHTPGMGAAALHRHLADSRLLLVLDSCDHLAAPCARLVADLLDAAPGLTVLATARGALGVPGEHVLALDPLPPSGRDALDLLRRAAGEHLPAAGVGGEICVRLEGIPLALELAAAQIRLQGAEAVRDQLGTRFDGRPGEAPPGARFDVLAHPERVWPSRHQTLRAAIGWSHELSEPLERLLWARLSVFRGPFDLASATAVCAGGPLTPALLPGALDGLVRASVVRHPDGAGRHRMLDTLREYGALWLDRLGETAAVADRHAHHFRQVARRAGAAWQSAPDAPPGVSRIRGAVGDSRTPEAHGASGPARASGTAGIPGAAGPAGTPGASRASGTAGTPGAAGPAGIPGAVGASGLARAAAPAGAPAGARPPHCGQPGIDAHHTDLRTALDRLLRTDPDAALDLIGSVAFAWSCRGRLREARDGLEQALLLSGARGRTRTRALWALGVTLILQGDLGPAQEISERCAREARYTEYQEARDAGRADRDRPGELTLDAAALAGLLALTTGRALAAAVVVGHVLDAAPEEHEETGEPQAPGMPQELGEREESGAPGRRGAAAGAPGPDPRGASAARLRCQLVRIFALTGLGHLAEARARALALRTVCEELNELGTRTALEYHLALTGLLEGDPATAADHARAMLEGTRRLGASLGVALGLDVLATALAAAGDGERAADVSGTGEAYWRSTGQPRRGLPGLRALREKYTDTARATIGEPAYEEIFLRALTGLPQDGLDRALRGTLRS
ncbi:ATP-binding protein [Streptomyces sp. NPDC003327]